MHRNSATVIKRAERVLRERIEPFVHTPVAGVEIAVHEIAGEPVPVTAIVRDGVAQVEFSPFTVPGPWGGVWTTTWFRVTGTAPAWVETAELVIDLGTFDHSVGMHSEAMVFRPDGTAVKSLQPRNQWVRLTGPGAPERMVDADGRFTLYVEAAANPLLLGLPPFVETHLGSGVVEASQVAEPYVLREARVCAFDEQVWELARDVEVVAGLIEHTHDDDPRHWRLTGALERALGVWDQDDPATAAPARAVLAAELDKPANASAHQVTAVGHAHIDSAWLWPVRETQRKVGRTVANVLALLESGRPMTYTMSAAQHYAWLEERYPDLYARLCEQVRAGTFVPVGGMWVEADGMMPTGESFVRQMTYGVRDLEARFGRRPREIWLPDSFGYSGALPQLARRAGFQWFLTQKISWNDTTRFPHHSFWWHGIDGTPIFTHFPPSDTYSAEVTAKELHRGVANFREKEIASHSLMLFGYGDGGGGPTREMIARSQRFRDVEGAAQVVRRSPAEFFADAQGELEIPGAPTWHGELYLEGHRGTLTSQIAMKQGNRRAEAMLRTLEYLATAATVRAGAPYPQDELDELWKTAMLNQFHDILPGSSIPWVHREAREQYAQLDARARVLAQRAVDALGGGAEGAVVHVGAGAQSDWTPAGGPATGGADAPVVAEPADDGVLLANGVLTARVDASGNVTSLRDAAAGRELVAPGQSLGTLQTFRDEPVLWDAWDIDRHVLLAPQEMTATGTATIVTDGRSAGVTVERSWGASTARLTWWLHPGADALDLSIDVDWQDREHLLKVCLPLALSPREAHHETHYGLISRPVHQNTAADEAQYETCAHRFTLLREPGYAIGVVNDGTYGVNVTPIPGGTLVRPSLLRSPRYPDPYTDLGAHAFRFAIVAAPHERAVLAKAAALNAPVLAAVPDMPPLVALEPVSGELVVDWVKLADDGSGDVVVRLFEPLGAHATARLAPGPGLADATVRETDLLETNPLEAGLRTALPSADPVPAAGAPLDLAPFQVATLRLTR